VISRRRRRRRRTRPSVSFSTGELEEKKLKTFIAKKHKIHQRARDLAKFIC
jgi:hypothetical protein